MEDFEFLPHNDDTWETLTESNEEDWLPTSGVREKFDADTLKLLNQF